MDRGPSYVRSTCPGSTHYVLIVEGLGHGHGQGSGRDIPPTLSALYAYPLTQEIQVAKDYTEVNPRGR